MLSSFDFVVSAPFSYWSIYFYGSGMHMHTWLNIDHAPLVCLQLSHLNVLSHFFDCSSSLNFKQFPCGH